MCARVLVIYCMRVCYRPGDTQHHHTDDDHLQSSDDGGDQDVVQFPGAGDHVQDVVLFSVALRPAEARVAAANTEQDRGERH